MNALGDALGDALGVPVDRSEELHLVACPCAVACAVLLLHLVAACPHARACSPDIALFGIDIPLLALFGIDIALLALWHAPLFAIHAAH